MIFLRSSQTPRSWMSWCHIFSKPSMRTPYLIVSADHETGGLHTWQGETGIAGERGPYGLEDGEYHILWTTRDHTSRPVPISAIGPNAQRVLGLQENTEVYHIMREAYGWD
jgi:alkaline phosphatase